MSQAPSSSSDLHSNGLKILLLLLILTFGLRLTFLGDKSMWLDEVNALRVAANGQSALWAGRSELYHPPLFYWLLEYWTKIGTTEFILRFPGALFGSISILLIYILAKDLFSPAVGLSAAGISAFSPLLIWYAQDMRPYALLCLLGLMVIMTSTKMFLQPALIWWILFVASMTAALYLHYFAVLLLPVQLLILLILLALGRAKWRVISWGACGWGAVILGYWPWLQTPSARKFLDLVRTGNNDIFHVLADRFNIVVNMTIFTSLSLVAGVGILSLSGLFILYQFLRWERGLAYLQTLPKKRWAQILGILLFLALLVASVVPRGYTIKRQLVILWPYAIVLFAWFWPWRKQYYPVLLSLLMASFLGAIINIMLVPKPQWREVTAYIAEHHQAHDLVVLEPSYYTLTFDYYDQNRSTRTGLSFNLTESQLTELFHRYNRTWLIVHGTDPHDQRQGQQWLDEHATLIDSVDYFRLQIRLYQRINE